MQVLVLASGSQYRARLLGRLNLEFLSVSPDIDESPANGEKPDILACRLAHEKACASSVSALASSLDHPAIIIASDQVAAVGDLTLGKPGNEANARQQLQAMSGKAVTFYTSLYMARFTTGQAFSWLDTTVATLRVLSYDEIERYIAVDQPFDCAGSFKMETSGISLFERVSTNDPTALIGLPMIAVCQGLRTLGVPVP